MNRYNEGLERFNRASHSDALREMQIPAEIAKLSLTQRNPTDMIAEAMWKLHVPEAENWVWGYDISREYAEKYRRAAKSITRQSVAELLSQESKFEPIRVADYDWMTIPIAFALGVVLTVVAVGA